MSLESLGEYILLEQYFMSENVAKAVEMDTMEGDPLTTSMLDEVSFIVKKCVKRAPLTNNVNRICAIINSTLIEFDFCCVFRDQVEIAP